MTLVLTESKKNKDFFKSVYEVVKLIPRGKITTYGAIAKFLGNPRGARMVGWALNGSSKINIPAHRVLNKQGKLTGRGSFSSPEAMKNKLEYEGVKIEDDKVLDFEAFYWDPNENLAI